MAKNLLLGIFVLFSVFFLACFLCYRWASVSLDFLTCPAHFWGRVRAAVSEQVRETLRGSGASSKEMAPVPMLCNTGHLGTIFGEKKVLMDKSPVGQVWSAAWHVPVASGVECPCRTGGSEGSSCCASCGVSVQLLNTGMCLAGEEKCKKTHFSQKSPFFQSLSGELPEWICKWLPASK